MRSFTLHTKNAQPSAAPSKNVLVTGAVGRIGAYFTENAASRYSLRLMGRKMDDRLKRLERFGEIIVCDLSDADGLRKACAGMDVVLHLAGDPSPSATWDDLLAPNIEGTFNIMNAARLEKCRKLIFASSIHAVSGYPAGIQTKSDEPVNPGDLYGVTKCFGEALGRYFAEQEGLDVIALRIGAFQPRETAEKGPLKFLDGFLSQRDLQQLITLCIDDTRLKFAVFQCLSRNTFNRMDISDAMELLGYKPQDNFAELNPQLKDLGLDQVIAHNAGDASQESGLSSQ